MSVLAKLLRGRFRQPCASTIDTLRDEGCFAPSCVNSRIFLYVGCGKDRGANIRHGFIGEWEEVRLDIDTTVQPDVVGTILDMQGIPDASVDAVYSAHTLEHLYAHEVPIALAEFRRVLKPGGIAITIVPDLQSIGSAITEGRLFETLYNSPIGAVTAFDVLYGARSLVAGGNSFMAHKSGFTLGSLSAALRSAGFKSVAGIRRPIGFDLGTIATCEYMTDVELQSLVRGHLPT